MNALAHGSSSESSGDEDDFLHPSTDTQADELADYNPRKRRRTGRDAKESAALGIFGSESEDEDAGGRKWKKKDLRSKGVAFVSTGQRTQDEDQHEDDDDSDAEMDDAGEEEEAPAQRGLGFPEGNDVRRAGWQNFMKFKKPEDSTMETPLGKGFVPSSAGTPILKDFGDEIATPRIPMPSAFSTPGSTGRGRKTAEAGTKVNVGSFAARMMAKMGHVEGRGLGKFGTGRSSVIEVTLRPQGAGLGAVKEKSKQEIAEEKRQAEIRGEKYIDHSDEERKKRRKDRKLTGIESGTGSGMNTPKRAPKPKFRTLEEVQKAAPGLEIPDAFAPILDMTGPSQRLLTSTSGLLTPTRTTAPAFENAEEVESKKLARRAQNDLTAYVEEWKNLQERKAYIEMTILQQQQEIDEERREYDHMKLFSNTVQPISQALRDSQWDPVIEALIAADDLGEPGQKVPDVLSSIAVAAVHPFLLQATQGWQPLQDPKLRNMAPQLHKIRHILGVDTGSDRPLSTNRYLTNNGSHRLHSKSTTAYESMIHNFVYPKIGSAISSWDVHDPAPLQALLDAWEGLLPSFVRAPLLDQSIVGKLNEAVSSWNPRKRHKEESIHELPHIWIFPWLQYLPSHHADPKSSMGLVSDVKRKFRRLIDSWDFHKGVVPGLRPWREVLYRSSSNDYWTPLIMNHVLPSMARFLRNPNNFLVDPNDQSPYMPSLRGILAWEEILKPRVLGQVVVETVFPMWHNVLHQWLTISGPNGEIGEWFQWWRDEVFPENVKNLKSIQNEFEKGHEMINQALDLGSDVATQLPAPTLPQIISTPPPTTISPVKSSAPIVEELTFRNHVENWCIDNDLQFLPEKKVLHSAGPLYRITAAGDGKNGTLVCFKGDSLYALTRKGGETTEIRIDWENVDAKDALLGMAWHNVKS